MIGRTPAATSAAAEKAMARLAVSHADTTTTELGTASESTMRAIQPSTTRQTSAMTLSTIVVVAACTRRACSTYEPFTKRIAADGRRQDEVQDQDSPKHLGGSQLGHINFCPLEQHSPSSRSEDYRDTQEGKSSDEPPSIAVVDGVRHLAHVDVHEQCAEQCDRHDDSEPEKAAPAKNVGH